MTSPPTFPTSSPSVARQACSATAPFTLGDTAAGCAQNRVAGDISRSSNFDNNAGATVVKGNQGFGDLACSGDSPAPTNAGQTNTAPSKTGQCAAL